MRQLSPLQRRTNMTPAGAASLLAAVVTLMAASPILGGDPEDPAIAPTPPSTMLSVEPENVTIGVFYNGATLDVRCPIAAGHEAAVVCLGNESKIELKRKGRVWGVLWMNTADISFEGVPSVYVLSTTAALKDLVPAEELASSGIGYASLRERAAVTAPADVAPTVFGELVQLKEHEGLFRVEEGGVRIERDGRGGQQLHARIFLPARVVPGDYEVRALAFTGGIGRLLGSRVVTLRQAGSAAFISTTAKSHGLVFGIAAVLIAMAAGLLTGLAFGAGSKRGH